jgi:cytochrome b subunit of formate dehydrogenase
MFLFRFHFQLHGIGWFAGRWIVGIAALSMLIALVSGVVIHRAFFRDFFTFRPNKGKRTWLDAHALAGVVSLPFHLAITFSGLLLLGALLMPSVVRSAYPDASGFLVEARGGRERFNIAPPSGRRAPLADIAPMIADAEKEWRGVRAGTVVVTNPGDAAATVEVLQARADSLARRGAPHRIAFDGVSGQRIETPQAKPPSAIASVWNALTTLHLGRFATPVQRWLLFLAGLSGTLMIATGLILWRISRFKTRAPEEAPSIACRGVEILNVSAIAGWLAAIGACFWAGRLLSASLAARGDWEIRVFFLVWAAALIHAASRRHLLAWVEQLFVSGGLIASLPLANALTGGLPLYRSIVSGPWQVAGFDAFALFFGAALLFAARRLDLRRRADALAENGEEARTARP